MTNFQIVTQSPQNLADFLYMIQDAALEAKGCSYNLKMPDPETVIMWDEWLKQEAEDDVCVTPRGVVRWAEKEARVYGFRANRNPAPPRRVGNGPPSLQDATRNY